MSNNNIKYINNFLFENEKNMILNWLNAKQFKNGINNDKSVIKRQQLWFQKEQKPFNKDSTFSINNHIHELLCIHKQRVSICSSYVQKRGLRPNKSRSRN